MSNNSNTQSQNTQSQNTQSQTTQATTIPVQTTQPKKSVFQRKGVRAITIISSVAIAAAGIISIANCSGCINGEDSSIYNSDDVNSDNKDNNASNPTSNNDNNGSNSSTVETQEQVKSNETTETSDDIESFESTDIPETMDADNMEFDFNNKSKLTADDLVKMSESFSEYVNKTAVLSHKYYKYEKLKPEDLYPVIFLGNITRFSKEEILELIDRGIISDNHNTNEINSYDFFELYHNDTLNKIMEGRTDIIDLSLILSDERDIEIANTMNTVITDFVSESWSVNYKNYMDTVYYYAGNVTLYNNQYDYSQSIYSTDRSGLSVGADYVLCFAATVIDSIAENNNMANQYSSKMIFDNAYDHSNIASVFNDCNAKSEVAIPKGKQLTK